ncbi:MAG: class I SAM-dependent methyltransferase [Bacteroidota bacterium]
MKKKKFRNRYKTNIDYWQERAHSLKELSVLNKKHRIEDVERITQFQISKIFPIISEFLTGDERSVLDFGCGPGRFSVKLANSFNCKVIAVDPIKYLLDLAPKNDNVEYLQIENNTIPAKDNYFDIVWICLVLGGIEDKYLLKIVNEIRRVSKENSIICLIENTSHKKNANHWYFRSVNEYSKLFKLDFNQVGSYKDYEEDISIMIAKV